MKKVRTHYENLQVVETATIEVIRGAYRHLAQKWHPDKNPGNQGLAERNTKIINEAFAVLSDPGVSLTPGDERNLKSLRMTRVRTYLINMPRVYSSDTCFLCAPIRLAQFAPQNLAHGAARQRIREYHAARLHVAGQA